MSREAAFFTLYQGLAREGPGEAADLDWALGLAGTPDAARICDAGAGSGADAEVLAEARRKARITAVEKAPALAAEARARLARFAPRVKLVEGDMARLAGPYDLIWSAGAVYFLGVSEALSRWRGALAPGGRVAFSEPVWLTADPPQAAREFWAGYPAISDLAGIEARVRAAGYRTLGARMIVGRPWETYYTPLAARIAALRAAMRARARASGCPGRNRARDRALAAGARGGGLRGFGSGAGMTPARANGLARLLPRISQNPWRPAAPMRGRGPARGLP